MTTMLARRAAYTALHMRTARLAAWRGLSAAPGPSAPADDDEQQAGKLSKEREREERARMVAEVMREKTMREVSRAAAGHRPAGITHVTSKTDDDEPQYAAKYDEDSDEWGGPKGARARRASPI